MFKKLLNFYKTSAPAIGVNAALLTAARFKSLRWKTFLAFTFGYTMFYICRLSLNVMKDPIVKEGGFTETELSLQKQSWALSDLHCSLRMPSGNSLMVFWLIIVIFANSFQWVCL